MTDKQPKVLVACPNWSGMEYALKPWADAYHAFTYENKAAFMVDNSDGPMTGGNLHFLHLIRGQGIPAVWQHTRWPALWDTLELSWRIIVEHAHEIGADFIFSLEGDVIAPPDAIEKMVEAAYEHADPHTGKVAGVTQRYHPRGQPGDDFWWATLGCSLFPTAPLYADRDLVKAIYEIEVFLILQRHGHPLYRPGKDGPDLFIPDHLDDPNSTIKYVYGATPAVIKYRDRVLAANQPTEEDAGEKVIGGDGVAHLVNHDPEPEATIPIGDAHLDPEPPPFGANADIPYAGRRIIEDRKRAAEEEVAAPSIDDMYNDWDLAKKVTEEKHIRLNLGSDRVQMSGFLSVDFRPEVSPDIVADVRDLSMFADDTVDEVYASHVLEHLSWDDGLAALKEWRRVLKPGGMLTVACPDLFQIYFMAKHGARWGEYSIPMDDVYVQATAFGAHLLAEKIPEMKDQYGNEGHEHKSIYVLDMLLNRVMEADFTWCHEVRGCFLRQAALGEVMVQGRKPKQGE